MEKNSQWNLIFLASALCALSVSAQVADVYANEQYVTVMRSEDYVYNNNTVGASPSLFIGLFHASIRDGPGPLYTMQTLVWHQVDFATQVEMRVAPAGTANTELIPAFIIASGAGAAPSACPVFVTFVITAEFLNFLRSGLVYVQIISAQSSGLLRGQLWSRRDALVAFPSLGSFTGTQYTATAGMAVVYVEPSPSQRGFVTMRYWILSRFVAPMVWNANNGFTNFSTAFFFGLVPLDQTTGVTLTITPTGTVSAVAPIGLVFTSALQEQPAATGPITGPGSSRMVLVRQGEFIEQIFSDFIRVAYYTDFEFVNITSSSKQSLK